MPSSDENIESLILALGRRDILGPNPAFDELRNHPEAVPQLVAALDLDDAVILRFAATLLGEFGAIEAIPKLECLKQSQVWDVATSAAAALAKIRTKVGGLPALDRRRAFEQIGELWTAIMQKRDDELCPPDMLRSWCLGVVPEMERLPFEGEQNRAASWGMLGDLLYRSFHPRWDQSISSMRPCGEAKTCYEWAKRVWVGEVPRYLREKLAATATGK